jgi:putative membrane protein
MRIKKRLSIKQILSITWKIDLSMIIFCTIIYYLNLYIFPKFILPIAFPALMGTAIAFFIGFSNNQAYNRWWEARIIWGGLYNDARIWTRTLLAHCNNKNLAEQMILRNIAFVYATAGLLRSEKPDNYLSYCTQEDLARLDLKHNIPNSLLNLQAYDLEQLRQSGAIDGFVFQELHELLINLGSGLGKSERIHYTVFPTTYVFLLKYLFGYLLA